MKNLMLLFNKEKLISDYIFNMFFTPKYYSSYDDIL